MKTLTIVFRALGLLMIAYFTYDAVLKFHDASSNECEKVKGKLTQFRGWVTAYST